MRVLGITIPAPRIAKIERRDDVQRESIRT
jgi:hypothetical protein